MTATQASTKLGVLKFYPTDPEVVAVIAKIISDHLKTPVDIDRLVEEMTGGRYDEWPGPGTLSAECRAINGKTPGQLAEFLSKRDVGVLCKHCDSWGYRPINGRYDRCDCRNGIELEQTLLDALNVRSLAKGNPCGGLRAISQEDFDSTVLKAIMNRKA